MKRVLGPLALLLSLLFASSAPALAEGPNEPVRPVATKTGNAARALSASRGVTLASLDESAVLKIDLNLLKAMLDEDSGQAYRAAHKEPVTYLVFLAGEADLSDIGAQSGGNAPAKVVDRLQKTADASLQAVAPSLDALLETGNIADYRSYWVFNGLAVDGDLASVLMLAQLDEVVAIRENRSHHLDDPRGDGVHLLDEIEWNIEATGAPDVWSEMGITGRGVVVANMDSGVDWTHPALQSQYRGYANGGGATRHDYNWFDATQSYPSEPGPQTPNISRWSDHGTHAMGSLVGCEEDGSNQIGMAPGAQWIAAKVFDDQGDSTDEWLHAGFQWCLAPTDLSGNNPNPALAPDIVSNSWGDDNGLDDSFRRDLEAWRSAGIFSAWASGNAGPSASTVGAPASYDIAFAVGAIDIDENIASYSSRGPSPWGGIIKPDVVAPGSNIRSSVAGGAYESGWNGTSMATPHVAGLAALMYEASDYSLTFTETIDTMIATARDLGAAGPDNDYGHGRIDAYQAVSTIFQGGSFAGQVTDGASGTPISGARLRLVSETNGGETKALTDAVGAYSVSVAAGLYDVTVTAFGYGEQTVEGLAIEAGYTTQLSFALERLPGGTISGKVSERDTGTLVASEVTLVGTNQVVTVDAAGNYAIDVPTGTYAVRAMPLGAGHRGALSGSLTVAQGASVTADLQLAPMPPVLVVDADAWSPSGAVLGYYHADLDELLIGHDSRSIADAATDVPSAAELSDYVLVIWAQAVSHPGFVGAWDELAAYVEQGGNLLISGQDIGYWAEQEGQLDSLANVLHASYVAEDAGLGDLSASPGGVFDGLMLAPNTDDSADNQTSPDHIEPADALAEVVWRTVGGQSVGLCVTACSSRLVYLAFGLEGMGPSEDRQAVLDRAVTWLTASASGPSPHLTAEMTAQTGTPGATLDYDLSFVNRGPTAASYDLQLQSGNWDASLLDPDSGQLLGTRHDLDPCEIKQALLRVEIPQTAGTNQCDTVEVRLVPTDAGCDGASLQLTAAAMPNWVQRESMPDGRYRAGSAVVGCRLYVVGGFDLDGNAEATVQVYDAQTGAWSSGPDLPRAAANVACAARNGVVYAIGGYDPDREGSERLAGVYALDTSADTWTELAPLPQAVSGMSAVAYGNAIYAFGGNITDGDLLGSYVYDIASDTWREGPALQASSSSFAQATVLDGAIYWLGGWPGEAGVWRLDPVSERWDSLAEMASGRHSFFLASDGRYLYAAGGGSEWQGDGSAERYDPQTDTWLSLPSMRFGDRVGATGGLVDGRLLVVGGTTASSGVAAESLGVRSLSDSAYWSVSDAYVRPGNALAYQMVLHNPSEAAIGASLVITMPNGAEPVVGSLPSGLGYDSGSRRLTWAGTLAANSGKTLAYDATVGEALAAGTVLTATATVDGGGCAPGVLCAVAEVSEPSLAASTKRVDQATTLPGAVLHYDIVLQNGSPFDIPSATLRDPLPPNCTMLVETLSGASYNAGLNRVEWSGSLDAATMGESAYEWIDATQGLDLEMGDDTCTDEIPLGFTFTFYGQEYDHVYVSSNGLVLFGEGNTRYSNDAIPDSRAPNAFCAPFWDDLAPNSAGAAVYALTVGQEPNRKAVFEWHNVPVYGQSERLTFEVLLFEGSNRVLFQYAEVAGERGVGNEATIGIENADGSEGVSYLYNGVPANHMLRDRLAIEMVHSSSVLGSEHHIGYDVRVEDGLAPMTRITNTAFIDDGLRVHEKRATTEVRSPDLGQSTKTCSESAALEGTLLDYTIHVQNDADVVAQGLRVTDVLPSELEMVLGSLTGGATYDPGTRVISWEGALGAESQFDIGYSARLVSGLAVNQRVTNTATLCDRGVLLRTLDAMVVANPVDLSGSSLSADWASAPAGEQVGYTLIVRNDGLFAADTVTAVNALPAELSMDVGSLEGGAWDAGRREVRWSGPLAPGASHTVTYRATVGCKTMHDTQIVNACQITTAGETTTKQAVVGVLRGDLSASSFTSDPARLDPGDVVTFTLKIANAGAFDLDASLSNQVPQGFTMEPATLYCSDGQAVWDGELVTWAGHVATQGLVVLRYRGRTAAGLGGVCLSNKATLTDSDGVGYALEACAVIEGNDAIRLPLIMSSHRVLAGQVQ